jgi:hypothetical protein
MVGAGSLWSIKPIMVSYLQTFSGFFQGGGQAVICWVKPEKGKA